MESRTQGSKPRPGPRTQKKIETKAKDSPIPKTDPLEAKDRNARGQGQEPRTQPQVLSKKRVFRKFFRAISKKKVFRKKFSGDLHEKTVFQKIFQVLHKLLTTQKIVLSSSRKQRNFRGIEGSRPRPRSSKCVLEAKDVCEDSTSDNYTVRPVLPRQSRF